MNQDAMVCPTCGQWSDEQDEHKKTRKELEELQDAVEYFSNHLYDNRYMIETTVELRQNMSKEESNIYDAIEASKRRRGNGR